MRRARVALTMLRYRAALMLWIFFLAGIARHGQLNALRWSYLVGLVALSAGYISATTVNDICDQDVDRINHPGRPDRPLVSGAATERDLWLIHIASSALALLAGAALGIMGMLLVLVSLLINQVYSIRPVRLSRRTYLTPVILTLAYVLLPYWLGVLAAGQAMGAGDLLFALALMAGFLGRINLKDFRDQAGDALHHKPTLLLRHGKNVTCLVSIAAALISNCLLLVALSPPWWLAAALELHVAAGLAALVLLWRAADADIEQFAIGLAAKMGNGLLLTLLAYFTMQGLAAPAPHQALLVFALTSLSGMTFVLVLSNPRAALAGYRG